MTTPLRILSLLVWLLAIGGGNTAPSSVMELSETGEECPRCDMLFSMVETSSSGERVQNVQTQERGEPKSGTTFMYAWAHGALLHTCNVLNSWFGSDSCSVHNPHEEENPDPLEKSNKLVFEPRRGLGDARCPCPEVDRVNITISYKDKHILPVNSRCRYGHVGTIAVDGQGCLAVDGRPAENYEDVGLCMEEANCTIIDDRDQFVILRDPRSQAVSTFYHEIVHDHNHSVHHWVGFGLNTVDEFVLATLPTLCQWLTIRYFLFAGAMAEQSTLFWYTDSLADPAQWHFDWLASVGLHLPTTVIEGMAKAASKGDFGFTTHGRNEHPGEAAEEAEKKADGEKTKRLRPSWKTEISPELTETIDGILRQWLPPVLLSKIESSR